MKKNLKVSIITPIYNCEKFLPKTIECVINQTYTDWEMLLVDDCSPDNSAKIIKKYAKDDNRIKYFKLDKNSGAAIARNKALEESKGRFIAYLDADDLWKSEKLEKQVEFMLKNKYPFTCTDYEKIDESGKIIGKVKENTKETRKLVSTAVAELIIMIQTGIEKVNYIMIILTLLVTISSLLYIVKKTNVKES